MAVELTETERRELAFRVPVLEYSAGPVRTVVKPGLCLDCGDYLKPYGVDVAGKYRGILETDFRAQFKQLVQESGVLSGEGPRLQWRATLDDFVATSTVSAYEERQHLLTAGGVLTIRAAVRYELLDGEKVLAAWRVESAGSSGTIQRWDEACGRALSRNLRKFFASLKQDLVQDLTPEEKSLIARIDGERDGKRSLVGNVVLGLSRAGAKTGQVVSTVGWAVMGGLAASAPALQESFAQANANLDQMQAQQNAFLAQQRQQQQQADALQKSWMRDAEQQQAAQKADYNREVSNANALRQQGGQQAAAGTGGSGAGRQWTRQGDPAGQGASGATAADAAAAKRKQEEDRIAQEEERRKQLELKHAEELRQKQEQEEADRQARQRYLEAVTSGSRLHARTCGDGRYFVVGTRPYIRPRLVECVDMHYAAYCEGSRVEQEGVIRTFLGASTDCYMSDATEISPRPDCPVDQVRVRAVEARECGE